MVRGTDSDDAIETVVDKLIDIEKSLPIAMWTSSSSQPGVIEGHWRNLIFAIHKQADTDLYDIRIDTGHHWKIYSYGEASSEEKAKDFCNRVCVAYMRRMQL